MRLDVGMLQFWFSPFGRAARADYWYWLMVPAAVAGVGLAVIGTLVLGKDTAAVVLLAAFSVFFVSHTALAIRRLHDQSVSGWYVLALFVPFGAAAVALISPGAFDLEALLRAEDEVKLVMLGVFSAIFTPFAIVMHMIWFRMGKDGTNRYGRDPLYR